MTLFPNNFPQTGSWMLPRQPAGASYSGLTQAGNGAEHLLVHDSKDPEGEKLSSFNGNSGHLESVEVNWSRTDAPEDLEAVASVEGQPGQFMAVEGSTYNGRTPHMFLFDYADGQAESLKRFDLPKLPYEIEGMVTKARPDGDVMVVLGGRGDGETGVGRLHWGLYSPDDQSMSWAQEGVDGLAVSLPQHLGSGERPISDLHLTPQGDLWAAGCTDNGDTGPFESLIYRVGSLNAAVSHNPVTLTLDHAQRIRGEKIEALSSNLEDESRLLIGTDNESFGGTLQNSLTTI